MQIVHKSLIKAIAVFYIKTYLNEPNVTRKESSPFRFDIRRQVSTVNLNLKLVTYINVISFFMSFC